GLVDEDATDFRVYYRDRDNDGHGDPSEPVEACAPPNGTVSSNDDCDDTKSHVHPGATEVGDLNDVDEDCDGLVNDEDPSVTGQVTWYRDADSDGFGAAAPTTTQCFQPIGYVQETGDCDD